MGRFSVDTWGQWHLGEASHCLVHSAGHLSLWGLGPACALFSEEGPWPPTTSCHRGLPFICLPSLHLHPSFSSPAAFTFIMPLSALLAAPQDHYIPPSPVWPASRPCGSQWPRVKVDSCLNRFTNLRFRRNQQFHQYFQVHWKSDLHHSHTIKANPSLIIALFVPSFFFVFFFLTRFSWVSCVRFVYIISLFTRH